MRGEGGAVEDQPLSEHRGRQGVVGKATLSSEHKGARVWPGLRLKYHRVDNVIFFCSGVTKLFYYLRTAAYYPLLYPQVMSSRFKVFVQV
jgi:hypothetical protein